jgi:universal stress protein E
LRRILVVVDPSAHVQAALAKAVLLAELSAASLELYVCDVEQRLPESWTGASRAGEYREMMRQRLLGELRALVEPLKARGLDVVTFCEWQAPEEQGIGHHVIRTQPDLVIKEVQRHGALERGALSRNDWNLIRQVPVPLLMVGSRPWRALPRIAAAVDPLHSADHAGSLDHMISDLGRSLADLLQGTLEIVHVLQSPPHLPGDRVTAEQRDRAQTLACNSVGRLATDAAATARFGEGSVPQGLVRLVSKDAPDVLLMGAVARPRWVHSAGSGTAAQVLREINFDLLIVKPHGFVSPLLVTEEDGNMQGAKQ